MFVQGDLDTGVQRRFLKRLGDVAERPGIFGPRHGGTVGVGRQIDHRDVEALAQYQGRRRAIHFSLNADVHQSDVGTVRFGLRDGIGSAGDRRGYAISQFGQGVAKIFGRDPLIFNNQNACRHVVFRPHSFRTSTRHDYTCDSSASALSSGEMSRGSQFYAIASGRASQETDCWPIFTREPRLRLSSAAQRPGRVEVESI